ncbi:DUF3263 domain-containing protein [Kocuria sp. M1R5S2]|uniref:DUF3263 domain-containing protein n=1 Tax=Kocuria rhizosphaerae TaxID=3376285 RepID=UPI0037B2EA24
MTGEAASPRDESVDGAAAGRDPAEEVPGGGDPAPGEESGDTDSAGDPAPDGLGESDREILAIEALQWKYQGAKEMEIRRRLGLSPTLYYQRLNVLIDTRAALEHAPMLVARLRRQRGDVR